MDIRDPVLGEPSIPHLFARLTTDAREAAQAEIGLAKARISDSVTRYRTAAIFFGIAAVLGLAALIALLVGLIISLATLVGPGLATAIVVGVVLCLAGIMALRGKAALRSGNAV